MLDKVALRALKDAHAWLQTASDSAKPTVYKYADLILDAARRSPGPTHHEAFRKNFLQEDDD